MNYVAYKAKVGWARGWRLFWSPLAGLCKGLTLYHRAQKRDRRQTIARLQG
jgi:hypothetical protein